MRVMVGYELEVKYYIQDPKEMQSRVISLAAKLHQPRTHELNLRFDTPGKRLTRESRVLRLRQDTAARLTYKGPSQSQGGVRARQEIEIVVPDFAAAQALLEALGYQVTIIYEKLRTVYSLEGLLVSFDELPYGNFIEIEGPDAESIQHLSQRLGLDWEARIEESYIALFERLRSAYNLEFRDLSFDNFAGLPISSTDLNVRPADSTSGASLSRTALSGHQQGVS